MQTLSGFDPETRDVRIVGMDRRMRSLLRDACEMRSEEATVSAVISGEDRRRIEEECARFCRLLETRWRIDIANHAKACELRRWCESPRSLPEDSDVRALFRTAWESLQAYARKLEAVPSTANFKGLSEALLAVLTVYNARRASEVAGAPLRCYLARPSARERESALRVVPLLDRAVGVKPADDDDGHADRRPEFFLVPGTKNSRPVAVIVPNGLDTAIRLVIRSRRLLGIPDPKRGLDLGDGLGRVVPPGMSKEAANELLFPRPDSARPFDLPTILRRFRPRLPDARRPELLTTRALRARLATLAARLSDPRDSAAVRRHLDHSEAVHERAYVSAAPVTAEQLYDIHARPDLRAGTSAEPHRPVEPLASRPPTPQPRLSLDEMQRILDFSRYAAEETRLAEESRRQERRDRGFHAELLGESVYRVSYGHRPPEEAVIEQELPVAEARPARRSPPPCASEASVPTPPFPRVARRWSAEEDQALASLFSDHFRERRLPTHAQVEAAVRAGLGLPGRTASSMRTRIYTLLHS